MARSFGGVALGVGTDVTIIATGIIGGGGTATIGFAPPFTGSTLGRYHVQAVTSPSPGFVPLQASAGLVLRNRDAIGPPAQMVTESAVFQLSASSDAYLVTPTFVAASSTTCLVTSSLQVVMTGTAVPAGGELASVKHMVSRNGSQTNDTAASFVAVSSGARGLQPALTLASTLSISAGETVGFGLFISNVAANATGAMALMQTTYACW